MNIEMIEQKIISYFEGNLSESGKAELLSKIKLDPKAQVLWDEYLEIYDLFEAEEAEKPTQESKDRFHEWMEMELKKEERGAMTIKLGNWRRLLTIAAAFAGLILVWNNYQSTNQMTDSLADLNTQMNSLLSEKSPTERIKTILVDYHPDNQQRNPELVNVLARMMTEDKSSTVRLAAVESLANYIEHDEVRAALVTALGSESDGMVKLTIINALGRVFDEKVKRTLENLTEDDTQEKFVIDEAHMQLIKLNTIKS